MCGLIIAAAIRLFERSEGRGACWTVLLGHFEVEYRVPARVVILVPGGEM